MKREDVRSGNMRWKQIKKKVTRFKITINHHMTQLTMQT